MSTRRAGAFFAAALLAGPAGARYALTAGYPWTVSETGTETASAIAVDASGFLIVAGNITRPLSGQGRNVLVQVYSLTHTGQPIGATDFDSGYGLDEGPPALKVKRRANWPYPPEVYAAFAAPTPTVPAYGLINIVGYFDSTSTIFQYADGLPVNAAPALDVAPSGTPYVAGWITAGGVDQLATMRVPRSTPVAFDYLHCVTATFWSGSASLSVTGRAIAIEASGAFRIVAQSGGDLMLFRYTTDTYPDPTPQRLKAVMAPGFPRAYPTAGWDEPHAAALDGLGYLWVAGSIDADGAVWRFDPAGNLMPGFPARVNAGSPSRLNAIALTADRRALVAGSAGTNLLVAGVDESGAGLAGLPLTSTPPAGTSAEGNGVAVAADGSAWIAGTWFRLAGETSIAIWHYGFTPDPPPVAPGEVTVRGPEGEILNLARGQSVSILALPRAAGDVRAQVLTPRGELVREFTFAGRGNELAAFSWDGRNAAGEFVASGLYAVRVTGGGLSAVRRIVVYRKR